MLKTLRMYCFVMSLIRMDVLKSNGLCKITNIILILVNLNSAQYFIHVSGYCFKLSVEWSGKKKGNLELYFWLCRGKNNHKELKSFRVPHTLQILDKEEKEKSALITLSEIEEHMD